MPSLTFDKSTIPDLSSRVLLITGGTGGIGAEITVEIAKHSPSHIFFTGRNAKSAEVTIGRIKSVAPNALVTFVKCDLASLDSVNEAADSILAQTSRLDIFLANAGIMAQPAGLSADGYEIHFATNHLGHALLTKKLIPLLEKTADLPGSDVRVVYTTSLGWKGGNLEFPRLKTTMESAILGRWIRYGNSKLANMLYARELTRRHPKLLSYSLHPGAVDTGLINDLKFSDRVFVRASMMNKIITPEQGTFNHLWAISVPRGTVKAGGFYEPVGVYSSEDLAVEKEKKYGKELWEYTDNALKQWLA
ncbi:oxidoreductase [Stachybotrys elegans]|uniref:Oxidoreductase n=1 Tax=Stachybotrys elegans TaxID=80388 RepID=A0A8K0WR85_9HYPO|nr:oxidoreductase [Stachybotrys elegans]